MRSTIPFFGLLLFCACQSAGTTEQPKTVAEPTVTTENAEATKEQSSTSAKPAAETNEPHSGTFVYDEKEPAENHKLIIPGEDSRELPSYFGSESASGEGIYFYGVGIMDMEMDAKGNFSFTVGERSLYAEPVTDLNHKPASDTGFSREELRYTGSFVPGGVRLICTSENQSCWADTFFMKRQ
jgi:hypothetical protein